MDNRPLVWLIWMLNLLFLGVLVSCVYLFLIQQPAPGSPAYVPEATELPELLEPVAWRGLDVHELRQRYAEGGRRRYDQPPYRALSSFDYHRLQVPSRPRHLPQVQPRDPTPPARPAPTAAEALADLQQKVMIVMLSAPYDAYVQLRQSHQYITLTTPDRMPTRGADSDMDPASEAQATIFSDLRRFGIAAEVMAIIPDGAGDSGIGGVRFRYTYRDETFTVLLTRPVVEDTMVLGGPQGDTVDRRTPGSAGRSREHGARDDASAQPADRPQGEPDGLFPGTIRERPGQWVVSLEEANYVNQNLDKIVQDLRPRASQNRETGEYEGITLTNVPESSHAARRGFVAGDVIKSINGVPVRSTTDAINYVRENKNLPQYVVVLERAGQERTLTYRNPRYSNNND